MQVIFAEYRGDIINQLNEVDYACAIIVGNYIIVLVVEVGRLNDLLREVPDIVNVERNDLFSLTQISPIDAANISTFHENSYSVLRGTGVIVGVLDTGIDYLNPAFMTEDNKTRNSRNMGSNSSKWTTTRRICIWNRIF